MEKIYNKIAEELKDQEGIEHCLIICGINTLKQNWKNEVKKHSKETVTVIGEKINSKGNISYATIQERANQLVNKIDEFFVIINIESIRDNTVVDAILNSVNKFDMIVFDELQCAKNSESFQGANLLKLSAKYMIGMTGTLIMNNPIDCYVALAWIGKERKNNLTRFKNTFCVFDNDVKGRIISFKNMDILKEEISSCSLRRTKDLLDLPEKNIINEFLDMDDAHKKFYDDVKKGIKSECEKITLKTNNLLSLVTRLRQATSCPQVLTTKNIISTKVERAIELVNEIVSNGDKVVVFSMFKEPIYQLQDLLKDYNPLVATGDTKEGTVETYKQLFQEDDIHKVFLGTVQKMGTGQTLTRASYMIMIDCPWTYALYEQATDRIHRIGTKKPVFIYNLICNDTIDYTVSQVLDRKEAFSDYMIDDKVDDKTLEILYKCIVGL